MKQSKRGFTLIEVLVVISILGVLMGLVSLLIGRSGKHKDEQAAKQVVKAYLPNLIKQWEAQFKRLPPQTIAELQKLRVWKQVTLENDTNTCSEVLLVALRHPEFTSRLGDGDLPTEEPFGNTDEDIFGMEPVGSPNANAREIIDPWGNPIVYIHKLHYSKPVSIMTADGEEIEVMAVKRKNGQYYNPTGFQLISLGPDGKQNEEPGVGDDITNFTVEDEE